MRLWRNLRSVTATAALFVGACTLALLLAEVAVRIVAPQRLESHRPIYENDSLLVYRLRKHYSATYRQPEFEIHEQTNALGLRDAEIGAKKPGVRRILGLGDSFSYSNSVNLPETFFKQIEAHLNAEQPGSVEVINAAVPAYSTIQELRYLERDGISLQPDVVVLGFYVGNDFQDSEELFDSLGRPTVDVVDGKLQANAHFPSARYDRQERTLRTATASIRGFFASSSALYVFLRERLSESLWRFGLRNNPPPPDFCARKFSPAMQRGWEIEQRLLLEMQSFCDAHGVRLIVVALPTQYQVDEQLWIHHFTTFGLRPEEYDLQKPQQILHDFCSEKGVEYVDVLPRLRTRAHEGASLFYPIASYMTPEGHRVVGDELCAYLDSHPRLQGQRTHVP
jgi:hypothetical protein